MASCKNVCDLTVLFTDCRTIVYKIVRQLAAANENLTGNVLKTILAANMVKEQICCMKSKVLQMQNE